MGEENTIRICDINVGDMVVLWNAERVVTKIAAGRVYFRVIHGETKNSYTDFSVKSQMKLRYLGRKINNNKK